MTERRQGRRRVYRLNGSPIRPVYDWSSQYVEFWSQRLDNLGAYLDTQQNMRPDPNRDGGHV